MARVAVEGEISQRRVHRRVWFLQCDIVRVPSHIFCRLLIYHSGWDIHDAVYARELLISNKKNGYKDIIASIDLSTYRRIPWENNVPFFLVSFLDPVTREPLTVDPRGILKLTMERAEKLGRHCYAGVEYEVFTLHSVVILSDNLTLVFQFQG